MSSHCIEVMCATETVAVMLWWNPIQKGCSSLLRNLCVRAHHFWKMKSLTALEVIRECQIKKMLETNVCCILLFIGLKDQLLKGKPPGIFIDCSQSLFYLVPQPSWPGQYIQQKDWGSTGIWTGDLLHPKCKMTSVIETKSKSALYVPKEKRANNWGSTGIWTRDLLHPKQESYH